jgi:hypothetical protein
MGHVSKRHETAGTKTGHHANQYMEAGNIAYHKPKASNL